MNALTLSGRLWGIVEPVDMDEWRELEALAAAIDAAERLARAADLAAGEEPVNCWPYNKNAWSEFDDALEEWREVKA